MQIGSNIPNNISYAIDQNKDKNDSILEKIGAMRELSGKDSADMVIANALNSQISTATQELQNANETIGMLQIADGALQGISDISTRMEDLSVRYNNAALSNERRNMLSSEFSSLQQASSDILEQTTYNGQSLFGDGSALGLGTLSTNSLDITSQDSVAAFQDQLGSLFSDVGSATQGQEVRINNLYAAISSTTSSYAQISEQPMDQKINEFQQSSTGLTASILAQSHQTQTLQKQMSALLNF